jgi:hypothetical protein
VRRGVRRCWKSKFVRFIQSYGAESLALKLDVRPSATCHWIRDAAAPRPLRAEIIRRLAGNCRCEMIMKTERTR